MWLYKEKEKMIFQSFLLFLPSLILAHLSLVCILSLNTEEAGEVEDKTDKLYLKIMSLKKDRPERWVWPFSILSFPY